MRSLALPVLFVVLFPLSGASRAQSISQDYARYSAMLNQERADAAQRDQQALYDQSARNARSSNSGSSSSGGSSSRSSSGSGAAGAGIGMLNGTLSSIVDRHNAAAAARRKNSTDPKDADTYEEMMRRLSALTDKRVAEKTKKEHEAFVQLTKQKAAAGDVEAGGQIGRLMVEGSLMKRDTKRGLELMSIAAEKGNTFIGRYLATFLMEGQYNVPVDLPKAHYWNMKFAEKGVGDLAYEACMDFVLGRGVGRDLKEAVRLCKVSFENESYDVAEMLGDLLNGDMPGIPTDYALAEAGYRRAMENHWKKNAPDKLTKLLLHSKDGGPDYAKLLLIYQQMADKGDRMDPTEGTRLLELAAGKGDPNAPCALGQIYLQGTTGQKDPVVAKKWFGMGADRGNEVCVQALNSL